MSQHKSVIPIDENKINVGVAQHPWAKIVKDCLSQKIKYAHNSIRNPHYPEKPSKMKLNKPDPQGSDLNRVQFTVIGDRLTKEFIFCCKLVKGLHKYRWKNFDVPVIKGVSTIEWPLIWNDLKIRCGGLTLCLESSVAVFKNDEIIGGEKELKELVEKQYIYHLCLDYYNEGVAEFSRFIKSTGRPFAYMHVSIDNMHIGTLIFMLYSDIAPYTCENFLRLCKEKRGGYGGTPVHRIVKDGWIQCGGFGLKNTPLSCENFIVPFDRRGVLAMANDGRDSDCSTQFFVLLQPAPWMNRKYVAFGQLIEGAATLEKIENVSTYYESPKSKIILYRCGILNMECQSIRINKGVDEYIDKHTEDLTEFSDQLWDHILEQVFLSAQLREIERLREQGGEGGGNTSDDGALRPTQRFKKEDIQKQIERNQGDRAPTEDGNEEFDVDEYDYVPEEYDYKHQSIQTPSLIVKPIKPYYLPLTDVTYPGDTDSNLDLRGFLQGKYCLESDLLKPTEKVKKYQEWYRSELNLKIESEDLTSDNKSESEMDEELEAYIKENVGRVSFAGDIVRSIAKKGPEKFNLFEDRTSIDSQKQTFNDEMLRKIRLASVDSRDQEERKEQGRVLIKTSGKAGLAGKIKRRQTGFVRPQDLADIRIIGSDDDDDDDDDDDYDSKGVRINPQNAVEARDARPNFLAKRRPTGFIRPADFARFLSSYNDDDDDDDGDDDDGDNDDDNNVEYASGGKKLFFKTSEVDAVEEEETDEGPSVLARLFKQVHITENEPTLKRYTSFADSEQRKNTMLTYSPMTRLQSSESTKAKYTRNLKVKVESSVDQILDLQHGKKITRKISSDYVRTINKDRNTVLSLRSVEFAKTRPTMSVSDYRLKNRKYREGMQLMSKEVNTVMMPSAVFDIDPPSTTDLQNPRDTSRKTPV